MTDSRQHLEGKTMVARRLTQRQAKMVAVPIIWTGYGILLGIVDPLKRTFIDGLEIADASFANPETLLTGGLFGLVGLMLAVGWTFSVLFAVFAHRVNPMGLLAVSTCLVSGGVELLLGLFTQDLGESVGQYIIIGNLAALAFALFVSFFTVCAYCHTVRKLLAVGRLPSNAAPSASPRYEPTV